MKQALALTVLAAMLVGTARAETLEFPSEAPVASVNVPDAWETEETETGIQAFSPDNSIAFYVDVADVTSREQAVRDAFAFLTESGVGVDPASDQTYQGVINGMESVVHNFDGVDENGPVTIGVYLFTVSEKKMLVATYWGTKGRQDKYNAEYLAIFNSIAPVTP